MRPPISADLAELRDIFLLDLDIQKRIKKDVSSPQEFVDEALKVASEEGLTVTEGELLDFIVTYANTGANQSSRCPTPPSNPSDPTSIPFPVLRTLPPGASQANAVIDVIRSTAVGRCIW